MQRCRRERCEQRKAKSRGLQGEVTTELRVLLIYSMAMRDRQLRLCCRMRSVHPHSVIGIRETSM